MKIGVKNKRRAGTRFIIERITKMYGRIRNGERVNAPHFAAEFETSTKTIQRDLEFMRDRLGLPIEWDGRSYVVNAEIKLSWWIIAASGSQTTNKGKNT